MILNLPDVQAGSVVSVATVSVLPTNLPAGSVRYVEDPGEIYRWDGVSWSALTAGSIDGPASSTDNGIVRWDGTSGDIVQDSGATISDAGVISTAGALLTGLTASRAVVTDGSKNLSSSGTSATELGYVTGVTGAIQTQIDGKQPLDSDLTAVAGLSTSGLIARTGSGTASTRTITGTANEVAVSNGDGVSGNPTLSLPTGIDPAKLANGSVSATEFQYLDGVTSAIQTQIDAKVTKVSATDNAVTRFDGTAGAVQNSGVIVDDSNNVTGLANVSATGALLSGLTASRAVVTDGSKNLASSGTSSTELGYVTGVTSSIQTQIDGKQPLDSDLTAVAGLSSNGIIARTGTGTASVRTITGTANEIAVSNGDGVSGNPTLSLPTGIDATKIADGTVTSTEFQYINTLTSNAQTQITAKAAKLNYQVKTMSVSDDSLTSTGLLSATDSNFKYSNLTASRIYHIRVQVMVNRNGGTDTRRFLAYEVKNGSTVLQTVRQDWTSDFAGATLSTEVIFTAGDTGVEINITAVTALYINSNSTTFWTTMRLTDITDSMTAVSTWA